MMMSQSETETRCMLCIWFYFSCMHFELWDVGKTPLKLSLLILVKTFIWGISSLGYVSSLVDLCLIYSLQRLQYRGTYQSRIKLMLWPPVVHHFIYNDGFWILRLSPCPFWPHSLLIFVIVEIPSNYLQPKPFIYIFFVLDIIWIG